MNNLSGLYSLVSANPFDITWGWVVRLFDGDADSVIGLSVIFAVIVIAAIIWFAVAVGHYLASIESHLKAERSELDELAKKLDGIRSDEAAVKSQLADIEKDVDRIQVRMEYRRPAEPASDSRFVEPAYDDRPAEPERDDAPAGSKFDGRINLPTREG